MLAIWNQLTRKGAWRNIFVTHNAFGIFSQYSPKKGDYIKAQKKKSCKSFDLQDSVAEREGFYTTLPSSVTC